MTVSEARDYCLSVNGFLAVPHSTAMWEHLKRYMGTVPALSGTSAWWVGLQDPYNTGVYGGIDGSYVSIHDMTTPGKLCQLSSWIQIWGYRFRSTNVNCHIMNTVTGNNVGEKYMYKWLYSTHQDLFITYYLSACPLGSLRLSFQIDQGYLMLTKPSLYTIYKVLSQNLLI